MCVQIVRNKDDELCLIIIYKEYNTDHVQTQDV